MEAQRLTNSSQYSLRIVVEATTIDNQAFNKGDHVDFVLYVRRTSTRLTFSREQFQDPNGFDEKLSKLNLDRLIKN